MQSVRNVYAVGRNYKAHAEELGNELPKEPMIFTKPTHALVDMTGNSLQLPGNRGAVHYEGELVLHISRDYRPGLTPDQLIDRMTLGLDLTLRDVQTTIKSKGLPWLPAKGFLGSAPIGRWLPFPGVDLLANTDFSVWKNDEVVQRGNVSRMIFDIGTILTYIAENYGLGKGDLIFTGTPEGVGPIANGDRFELKWGEVTLGMSSFELHS